MEKDEDPYEILGLTSEATESEIKKAFHKAALKYHPDKQNTEEDKKNASQVFVKISAAYDLLTDPVKRYDWRQRKEELDRKKARAATAAASIIPRPRSAAPLHGGP